MPEPKKPLLKLACLVSQFSRSKALKRTRSSIAHSCYVNENGLGVLERQLVVVRLMEATVFRARVRMRARVRALPPERLLINAQINANP